MSDTKVGLLISDSATRDAIHVAIAPVKAGHALSPGQRIGFVAGDTSTAYRRADGIGIVDPFLLETVAEGEWFYMFLLPNSVTGMRHHWAHPAFDQAAEPETKVKPFASESERFIAMMADSCGVTVNDLMNAASYFVNRGFHYSSGQNERYKDVWDSWPEFWTHFEHVTGIHCDEPDSAPFSCSC